MLGSVFVRKNYLSRHSLSRALSPLPVSPSFTHSHALSVSARGVGVGGVGAGLCVRVQQGLERGTHSQLQVEEPIR